ncbi:MAG: response regulator [Chitinophagaceae bacterium]|nr:MAG: response regulator [Chitinophagaceae bacterium]
MNRNGPVIIIEDDIDDQEILSSVFTTLGYTNQIIFFNDGEAALGYLNRTDVIPFLILSDVNMPKLDGFALRDKVKMDAKLQVKCIPYLFFTTSASQQAVIDAYSKSVQGFFVKENTMEDLTDTIDTIMRYWKKCSSPNNFLGS